MEARTYNGKTARFLADNDQCRRLKCMVSDGASVSEVCKAFGFSEKAYRVIRHKLGIMVEYRAKHVDPAEAKICLECTALFCNSGSCEKFPEGRP